MAFLVLIVALKNSRASSSAMVGAVFMNSERSSINVPMESRSSSRSSRVALA